MNYTIEQFNKLRFNIKLNKTSDNKGTCTAKSKCGAIVQFKYFYNKKLSGFEMQIDKCGLLNAGRNGTNLTIVDDNKICIDDCDLHTAMYSKFNTQRIWAFIKKFTA